jgi:DNA-binding NtrC family response regulator
VNVVVLDVKMPGMDGVEVFEQIKQDHPRVAVIMLTGHATMATAVKCMQMGAFDHLFKPHAPEDLVGKILLAAERARESG